MYATHLMKSIIFLICITGHIFAQNVETNSPLYDSLKIESANLSETAYHELLLDNAYSIFNQNSETGLNLIDELIDNLENSNKAQALMLKGTFMYLQGNYDEALPLYQNSLDQYEKLNDKAGMGTVYNELSIFSRKQKDPAKAEEYLDQSQALCEDANDLACLGTSHNNRGMLYQEIGKPKEAKKQYVLGINYKRQIGDSIGLSYSYNNMASIMIDEKNFDKAIKYINLSTIIREQAQDESGIAINLNNVGEVYFAKEEYLSAIDYFGQSLNRSIPIGFTDLARHTYNLLGDSYKLSGNYKQALITKEKSFGLNDSLHNASRTRIIEEMETKYETEKKETEIAKQKTKNKYQLLSWMGSLVLGLAFFMIWYNRYRFKRKMELEKTITAQQKLRFKAVMETEDNERKRFAQDLHDGLGQLLSTARMNVSSLEDAVEEDVDDRRLWKNSLSLIDEACTEVRNVSHGIMPNVLIRSGLQTALEELVNKINISSQLQVNLNLDGIEKTWNETEEVIVYRIIQEILNNTIKHADASQVDLMVNENNSQTTIEIIDNGRGIDLSKIENSKGIGWKNIRSRVDMLNGKMTIESNNGTRIKIVIKNSNE